jgi:hypothetical protein
VRIWSRLSGRDLGPTSHPVLPGLLEIDGVGGSGRVRLVPDGSGAEGLSFVGSLPDAINAHALACVVAPVQAGATWSTWAKTLPLVPDIGEQARLQPLDLEIVAQLSHLQHVCHRPRLHLRVDEERLRVSRARRIAPRAIAWLASHPADWERRTLQSIRPAHVVATVVEDEWNIYENRVAARLVDHLLDWIGQRIERLERFKQMAEDGERYRDEAQGSHRRARRLFLLWGALSQNETLTRELQNTLATLIRVQRDLQALIESPLYRAVPTSTFVPVALRPTNILINDPHYRKVAALWRSWASRAHVRQLTRAELRRRRQAECQNFDAFALLVVVRALADLGYRAVSDTVLSDGAALELTCPVGPARLTLSQGTIRLQVAEAILSLVPVPASIPPEAVEAAWQQFRTEAQTSADALFLVAGGAADLAGLDGPAARAFSGWERPRVIGISPWSLDCIERLARVLRAWEAPYRMAGYPARAPVRADPGVTLPKWLRRVGPRVVVTAPAGGEERLAFARACEQQKVALGSLQKKAQSAKQAFDPGRLLACDTLASLAAQAADLEAWQTCPVCGSGGNDFQPRPGNDSNVEQWSWWCSCTACDSEWGLRVCRACAQPFPVLELEGGESGEREEPMSVGTIDRQYGRDLWAEPCWASDRRDTVRCSRCGQCPGGTCARCVVPTAPARRETPGGR